jgi:hypothetical protein
VGRYLTPSPPIIRRVQIGVRHVIACLFHELRDEAPCAPDLGGFDGDGPRELLRCVPVDLNGFRRAWPGRSPLPSPVASVRPRFGAARQNLRDRQRERPCHLRERLEYLIPRWDLCIIQAVPLDPANACRVRRLLGGGADPQPANRARARGAADERIVPRRPRSPAATRSAGSTPAPPRSDRCPATIKMDVVLPHPGMLPSGPSIASPECSRRHVSLSIDYTGSAAHAA